MRSPQHGGHGKWTPTLKTKREAFITLKSYLAPFVMWQPLPGSAGGISSPQYRPSCLRFFYIFFFCFFFVIKTSTPPLGCTKTRGGGSNFPSVKIHEINHSPQQGTNCTLLHLTDMGADVKRNTVEESSGKKKKRCKRYYTFFKMFMDPRIVIIFWYIIPTRCTSHRVYLIWY